MKEDKLKVLESTMSARREQLNRAERELQYYLQTVGEMAQGAILPSEVRDAAFQLIKMAERVAELRAALGAYVVAKEMIEGE